MAYTPENNPYIPGDPYSYDLKWVVNEIDKWKTTEDAVEAAAASAEAAGQSAEDAAASAEAAADSAQAAVESEAAAKDYAETIADPVSGLVSSWLNDHITQPTTPAIDTSLSVAGAAADAKAVGDIFVKQLNSNANNIATSNRNQTETVSGITYTINRDFTIDISGTANATSMFNIWQHSSQLPAWWQIGDKRRVTFTYKGTGTPYARVYNYKPNATLLASIYSGNSITLELDASAVGFALQIHVPSGETVSGHCEILVTAGELSNKILTNKMDSMALLEQPTYKSIYKIGVIGDSYSAIRLFHNGSGFDSNFYSWVKHMEKDAGMAYENLAASGYECLDWIDGTATRPAIYPDAIQSDKLCQVYLICMGINDSARHDTSYIGTTADINIADPEANAASFIGYYAKIIQKLKAVQPNALFILFTMPTYTGANNQGTYEFYNNAIRNIANFFNYTYLADLYNDFYEEYHRPGSILENPGGVFVNNGHYTAAAQPAIANIMEKAISKVIDNNKAAFANLATTGQIWEP